MTVQQGLYRRAAIFAVAAGLVALVLEAFGPALVAAAVGAADAPGIWTGVRMAGWSVVFLLAMLALGRLGAAYSYGAAVRATETDDDPDVTG